MHIFRNTQIGVNNITVCKNKWNNIRIHYLYYNWEEFYNIATDKKFDLCIMYNINNYLFFVRIIIFKL